MILRAKVDGLDLERFGIYSGNGQMTTRRYRLPEKHVEHRVSSLRKFAAQLNLERMAGIVDYTDPSEIR
jgi:hypothetical protein